MEHTHEHDCIVCGAHFDALADLDRHNREQHLRTASGNERPRQNQKDSDDDQGTGESGRADLETRY